MLCIGKNSKLNFKPALTVGISNYIDNNSLFLYMRQVKTALFT